MPINRRDAVALLTASICTAPSVWSQQPPDMPPPPPDGMPMPAGGYGGLPGGAAIPLPHQGNLQNAPTSAAASRNAKLPTVAIREFRSSVAEIAPRGATDMFIVALVKSRKFRVLERARMAEGVGAEKALHQQGMTTGDLGHSQYLGATYLFEATISEASVGERRSSFTLGVAGAAAGTGSTSDSLAIDVRVTDVESGVVVDAVSVRKELKSVETKVAGVTSALVHLFTKGKGSAVADALAPNDQILSARKDSVDRTLREAIAEAVAELAQRLATP